MFASSQISHTVMLSKFCFLASICENAFLIASIVFFDDLFFFTVVSGCF